MNLWHVVIDDRIGWVPFTLVAFHSVVDHNMSACFKYTSHSVLVTYVMLLMSRDSRHVAHSPQTIHLYALSRYDGTQVKDSRFGHALVIETTARSGGYTLGFRVDPVDKLNDVFLEIKRLHEIYSKNPSMYTIVVVAASLSQQRMHVHVLLCH